MAPWDLLMHRKIFFLNFYWRYCGFQFSNSCWLFIRLKIRCWGFVSKLFFSLIKSKAFQDVRLKALSLVFKYLTSTPSNELIFCTFWSKIKAKFDSFRIFTDSVWLEWLTNSDTLWSLFFRLKFFFFFVRSNLSKTYDILLSKVDLFFSFFCYLLYSV